MRNVVKIKDKRYDYARYNKRTLCWCGTDELYVKYQIRQSPTRTFGKDYRQTQ